MTKRTGPTNPVTKSLVIRLVKQSKKEKVEIWSAVAERIKRPSRQRAEVNLNELDKYCKNNETVIIPGKLLGAGMLTKPLNVAALSASKSAIERLNKAKGIYLSIEELMNKNPKGSGIKIMA